MVYAKKNIKLFVNFHFEKYSHFNIKANRINKKQMKTGNMDTP